MKNYLSLLVLMFLLNACNSQEKNEIYQSSRIEGDLNYEATVLPEDTSQLYIGEGDLNSDTVLIIAESGPKAQLTFDWRAKEIWSRLPNYFNYYRAHIHQATTLNNGIYDWKYDFTEDMAQVEIDNGTEILARTIKHFKEKNKKVIVIGTFWSAFVIQDYIAKYGNNADKYLISAGRLDINEEHYKYHLKGFQATFTNDGKTPIAPDTLNAPDPLKQERYSRIVKVTQTMKGVMKRQRFTEKLAGKDLSNVVYAYATNDTYSGALTDKELAFLKSKSASVYSNDKGHFGVDAFLLELLTNETVKL
ncbi:hypothetical protein [Winogradskyella haliclonae]|uniref:Uncharacterized protein n=1 Tax=Winogradskyella haliclonae TaxID=2048558 RepID=A0ABQ2C0K5_9FLAO|nr:hypothetical protein [Winogradskyella haliclonae]GGI57583.1 hypothetical protein GCM10011444_18920 [Winogradskyella haliclonae]